MKKRFVISIISIAVFLTGATHLVNKADSEMMSVHLESEFQEPEPELSYFEQRLNSRFPDLQNWKRPEGPFKVGLQVGHWKNSELPQELERLIGSVGTKGGGKTEVEVNSDIAQRVEKLLEVEGIDVDILPATVPKSYWADLFVAIHADGNASGLAHGFKASGPYRDYTQRSDDFLEIFYEDYEKATGLIVDDTITRNMRGYYAFNWWRNEHAIHPMTPGVIIETGFLTNDKDQQVLIHKPELAAQGIADSIFKFLDL